MKRVTVFDFDGTLTLKDSMMSIIIFQRGKSGLIWALLRELHLLVLMFMGLYSNQKAKERLLTHCFGGMKEQEFEDFCHKFAESHRNILNPATLSKLQEAKERGDEVFIITASPVSWVGRFIEGITVLGSHMEVKDGIITGKLVGLNCYGEEKVQRLLRKMPEIKQHREDYYITAYGDSRGDREMLAFANEGILIEKE